MRCRILVAVLGILVIRFSFGFFGSIVCLDLVVMDGVVVVISVVELLYLVCIVVEFIR